MSTIPASAIVSVQPNVSSAGGAGIILNGLFLTKNAKVPIGAVMPFSSADDVGNFFGLTSNEFAKANIYFNGFFNSSIKPGRLLFAQYNTSAVAAYVRGNALGLTLAQLKALTPASLSVVIDAVTKSGSVDLSTATSFTMAAELIATALSLGGVQKGAFTASIAGTTLTVSAVASGSISVTDFITGVGVAGSTYVSSQIDGTPGGAGTYSLTGASQTVASVAMTAGVAPVAYDSTLGSFTINSGTTGATSTMAFPTGAMASSLQFTEAQGAVLSQGAIAAVPGPFMTNVKRVSQNWGTFTTLFNPDADDGNSVKLAFAAWTNSQNNGYAYICWDNDITPTNTVPATASLGYLLKQGNYSGTALIWEPSDLGNAAFVCGAIASIDFTEFNGRTTLAFRYQTGMVAGVTDQTVGDNLLANGYNFYGAYGTRNEANNFVFLYNGSVSGPFAWLDSYINQIWMNDGFQVALMTLLVQAKSVPYNFAGRALIEASCQDVINRAGNFGVFRPGVTLSESQAALVNSQAGAVISNTLYERGWYEVFDADPLTRQQRKSPPMRFWHMDGQSVQQINLVSTLVE